jgi:choloylglycine hydrolase
MHSILSKAVVFIFALLICTTAKSEACTGFFIQAKDGGVAYARSNEFTADLKAGIAVVPKGHSYRAQMPDGSSGLEWKNKYAMLGMNIFGLPYVHDGFNDQGLQVGMFFFPGFAKYAKYSPKSAKKSLAPFEFGTWLLSNFATVEEVRKHVNDIQIVPTILKGLGISPPLHTLVVDSTGKSIVIEPINGKLVVHDNPVHVMTNSPTFDWHLTNLRQYIKLSNHEIKPRKLGELSFGKIGSGSGMVGLPGDITPPSRFVRAAYYVNMIPKQDSVEQSLNVVMRLMNSFFITKGMVIEDGKPSEEFVQWQLFTDLKNKRLYFSTYDNLNIRMVDMKKLKLDSGPFKMIKINQPQEFPDISDQVAD